ncbi:MAG TPA: hypothetical protein VE130_00800 [Nitrososphaeraceae archaeon]|nr:hypothetical protein [Nitrososphaeraceae archaeon]
MSIKKDESPENDEVGQDPGRHLSDANQRERRNQSTVNESSEKAFKIRSNTLDEGTIAFIHWLSSTHKRSPTENIFVVKDFQNDRCTILWDSSAQAEVRIDTKEGVPICQYCGAGDCAHVGFTICLEQLHGRGETLESIEAETEVEGGPVNKDNQIGRGSIFDWEK